MLTYIERGAVRRFFRIGVVAGALAWLAGTPVRAAGTTPVPVAVLPLKLLDTSGEPADQSAQHAVRLARLTDELAVDLTSTGLYRAEVLPAERLRQDCPTDQAACLLQVAQDRGAQLIFVGVVHKSSTLILQLWARLVDVVRPHAVAQVGS
ncbi:hypothetical protein J2X36_005091 [Methylobacterium sp. BE186]|uniref:DUF2380 domain-containing protein n=1 Tax=Methylobacterium sp. BE186 TaxID=2817715 RepID=UPI0028592675|nr:DUF2380 domain-containing protein [Methylobacterium sp. BE186]MDR7040309.1 hypothetical protein [Methylobacterium sp. BE186]